jgi:phage terminase large subunit
MGMSLPHPHAKQREFMRSMARFKVLVWGRRTGKSLGIGVYTLLKALEKQGNYYIVAPTYKQAKSIYWQDILKVIIPDELILKKDESDLYIQLKPGNYTLNTKALLGYDLKVRHDPNLPPSTIYLKGADNPDSLRGVSLSGAVLDEFAFFKDGSSVWQKIIRPALGDNQGWAVFSSTPDGVHNPFYDIVERAKANETGNWFLSTATALENPWFPKQEWAETKIEYEKEGKIDEWAQEWEALFTTPSTLVYNEFSDAHIIAPKDVPRVGTNALAMDFGLKDPFACVFVRIDYDNNWYVYDEIYQPDLPVDKIARIVHEKMGDEHFTRMIGDSAGATEMASLRSKALGSDRLWVTPSKKGKDSIRGGIRQLKTHLYVREGSGKPKLFVSSNCRALIREFQTYKYMRDAWGELTDRVEDRNNHLLDALRYLVNDHAEGSKPIPKAQNVYDPETGRLLS